MNALSAIIDAGGLGLEIAHAGEAADDPAPPSGIVRLGIDERGDLPAAGRDAFDVLLTTLEDPPAPWVYAHDLDAAIETLRAAVAAQPVAAAAACQVLRVSLKVGFDEALAMESLAYSMLLASGGFRAWRAATSVRAARPAEGRISVVHEPAGPFVIRLNRPGARNAVDAAMRDALVEALNNAGDLPADVAVILEGEGPSFCAGGDLDEFGQADDPGRAHAIRTLRSAAGRIHALQRRVTARLHGACIGAGIEMPAAAGWITARRGTVLRLPEVGMGLIPGAGGTASIPRRIGRQRAGWMALTGAEIDVETALAWGLVDALDESP